MKKPTKKDNTINEKKLAQQQQQLVDLEEKFLKFVGADLDEFEKNKNEVQQQQKEERKEREEKKNMEELPKKEEEKKEAAPQKKVEHSFEAGARVFKLTSQTKAGPRDLQLAFTV